MPPPEKIPFWIKEEVNSALSRDPPDYSRGWRASPTGRWPPRRCRSRHSPLAGRVAMPGRQPDVPAILLAESPRPERRPRCAGHLSCRCHTRGLKHGDGRSRLIDQGFNDDGRHPGALHVERVGSTRRVVDNASASLVEHSSRRQSASSRKLCRRMRRFGICRPWPWSGSWRARRADETAEHATRCPSASSLS